MKKVYKYATGEEIPKGAVFLSTVAQTEVEQGDTGHSYVRRKVFWVWHYFLVETAPTEKKGKI